MCVRSLQVKWVKKEAVDASAGGDDVVFSKYSRKDYIDNLRKILAMEIESMYIEEKDISKSVAHHADLHKVAKQVCENGQSSVDREAAKALELEAEFGEGSIQHQQQLMQLKWGHTMLQTAQMDLDAKLEVYT